MLVVPPEAGSEHQKRLHAQIFFLSFQIGIVFNFDESGKFHLGDGITFGTLHFIADGLGNLHLQEPKPIMKEEEPLAICMSLAGLEDAIATGALPWPIT